MVKGIGKAKKNVKYLHVVGRRDSEMAAWDRIWYPFEALRTYFVF